ncbi:MAG: hypothetical protein V7646_2307, partial [Pseudonocardia sp.]
MPTHTTGHSPDVTPRAEGAARSITCQAQ